jgi:citrate synthase
VLTNADGAVKKTKAGYQVVQDLRGEENLPMRGMNNLVADTTSVSWVDGAQGKLYYRGISIEDLVLNSTFEETAYLLLFGGLPNQIELEGFSWRLRNVARTPEKVLRIILEQPKYTPILSILQTALAALGCLDPMLNKLQKTELLVENSLRIIAHTSSIVAIGYRHSINSPTSPPRRDLSFAESFLYLLNGKQPTQMQAKNLDIALICQMDHGFNSSTFTARTVASTLALSLIHI